MSSTPPRRAERLAAWSLAPWERSAVLGDLAEEFYDIQASRSERAARRWYWRQTVTSIWPNARRRLDGDERRREVLANSGWTATVAAFCSSFFSDWSRSTGWFGVAPAAWGLLLLFLSAIQVAQALFSERVQMVRAQAQVRRMIGTAGLALLLFLSTQTPSTSRWIGACLFTILVSEGLRLWPRWRPDAPPPEFAVGMKSQSPAPGHPYVVTTVPNVPLGLSDLVLCRPSRPSVANATWMDDSTIQRTFVASQSFRVCAVVTAGCRSPSAVVDLVDAAGRPARHLDADVVVGALAAIPRTWDDLIDGNPPDHFGQIDTTVSLYGLEPGPYTVRLTVCDGGQTSVKAEQIVVAVSDRPATEKHSNT